jgi:hypothetical protein
MGTLTSRACEIGFAIFAGTKSLKIARNYICPVNDGKTKKAVSQRTVIDHFWNKHDFPNRPFLVAPELGLEFACIRPSLRPRLSKYISIIDETQKVVNGNSIQRKVKESHFEVEGRLNIALPDIYIYPNALK